MLLHSLWIGGLIALTVMLVEHYAADMDNRLRHLVYRTAILAFLAVCGVLLLPFEWTEFLRPDPAIFSSGVSPEVLVFLVNSAWLLGFLWFLKRHIESQIFIRKVFKNSGAEFPDPWHEIFERLKQGFGTSRYVSMIHSKRIRSAFVYGIFKPVIVIPTCWVNRLEYHEAECILAHELSHLRAGDHFFNAICNFCDMVFFFNPAVRYITGRLRFQRELCADDLAAGQVNNIHAYASLILKLGENPGLVVNPRLVGFGSEKNQLLKRVRNLLKLPTRPEFSTRLGMSILCGVVLWAFALLLSDHARFSNVQTTALCESGTGEKNKIAISAQTKSPVIRDGKERKELANKSIKTVRISSGNKSELQDAETRNDIAAVMVDAKARVLVDTQITIASSGLPDSAIIIVTQTTTTPSGKQEHYWEARLMESRQDLKKWIQVITEEALQSNMKNIRFISDLDRIQRARENKQRVIIMDQHRNISIYSRYADPGSADQSVIN
jgi:beta-lactamase regulating signal transducer with metallopeptidase domain